MSDTIVLDSNAIIALFHGERRIAELMGESFRIVIPAVVCGEIDSGTQGNTARERKEREAFSLMLANPKVFVHPVTRASGAFYAKVFAYAKSVGKPIPTNDIWIAAATLEIGGLIVTNDRHLLSLPLMRTAGF